MATKGTEEPKSRPPADKKTTLWNKVNPMKKKKKKKKKKEEEKSEEEEEEVEEEEEDDETLDAVDVVHISKYRMQRGVQRGGPVVDLEAGVIKDRKLTDPAFIVIFALCICGMCFVASRSWTKGDPFKLIYGTDSFGNTCHKKNKRIADVNLSGQDFTLYKKVFFMNPEIDICIKKCIDTHLETPEDVYYYIQKTEINLCLYNVTLHDVIPYYNRTDSKEILCPELPRFPEKSVFSRCVRDASNDTMNDSYRETASDDCSKQQDDIFTTIAIDLQVSVFDILILCATAVVISASMLLLIGLLTEATVWVMFLSPLLICIGGMAYCWQKYTLAVKEKRMSATGSNSRTWLCLSILVTIGLVVILLILFLLFKKVYTVIPVFKEAGAALRSMPMLLVQPFAILAALIGVVGLFVWLFLYMQSAFNYSKNENGTAERWQDPVLFWFKWYYIASLIWIVKFLFGCERFLVTSAVSDWYFTRNKELVDLPVNKAVIRLVTRHLGSVIFGSLVINFLLTTYQTILKFIIEKSDKKKDSCSLCIRDCCSCCTYFYDRFFKYIDTASYVMTGIYGCSFLEGCQKAYVVSSGVGKDLAHVCHIGNFIILLGEAGIISLQFLLALYLTEINEEVCLSLVPIFVSLLATTVISYCFLEVYKASMEALFICFCEDTTRNDGRTRLYFMSGQLKEFLKQEEKERAMQDGDLNPIQGFIPKIEKRPQKASTSSEPSHERHPSRPESPDRHNLPPNNSKQTDRLETMRKYQNTRV